MEKNYWENEERKLYHPTFASYMLEIYAAKPNNGCFSLEVFSSRWRKWPNITVDRNYLCFITI